jgi:drug/metabolite transporter (DMT)-like permease
MGVVHFFAITSAVSGSAAVSLGMVLQKKGVASFIQKNRKDPRQRRNQLYWILGFGLNNSLVFFYYFALKGLDAAIVGSMMSLNILFTALFSSLILQEPLSKQIVVPSLILLFFIVLAHLSGAAAADPAPPPFHLVAFFFGIPFALVLLAVSGRYFISLRKQTYASFFAMAAGCLEGIIIVLVKAIQTERGDKVLEYLGSPYFYMYVIASLGVVGFMQIAYLNSKMTKLAPILWGTQIAYPILISYIAFSIPMSPVQILSFVGILACVLFIQTAYPGIDR